MAINDGFYWYKNVLKKQLKLALRIYLSIAIVLSPIFLMSSANASSVGGWSMGNPIAKGASTIYEGSKNVIINGADYVKKGTATITPTAANVAKTLGKGVAGVAVSVVIDELLDGVDWVLDPANNQIVYTKPPDPTDPTVQYYWQQGSNYTCFSASSCKSTLQAWSDSLKLEWSVVSCSVGNNGLMNCPLKKFDKNGVLVDQTTESIPRVANPAYDPSAPPKDDKKTIPLDTVAEQVISNANAGDTTAQAATTAAAADIVAEAETDSTKARPISQQLEASSTTKPADEAAASAANTATGTQTQNPTKPETSDIALEFPTFCGWSPVVCEAAQVVISFPQTLTDWWEAAKDWATSEPQQNDPENLEIEDLELDASDVNLTATGTCPQDSVSFSVMGQSVNLDMPYQPVCDALNFFKPAVLLVGAVASVYIVAGVRTKEEDQP